MKNTIKFSKDWLVKLSQTKPEKRIEYKDSDNKFLRALSGRDVTDDYTGYTDSDDLREALERIEAKLMSFINNPKHSHAA
jgi:hypothetical protein